MAVFSKRPFIALSIVAILEPPNKKFPLLYVLPAAVSLALSAAFKVFIESTIKSCVNVAVPPVVKSKYDFKRTPPVLLHECLNDGEPFV